MQVITGQSNDTVKKYASLKEKKFRELHGLYLLEGARIVKDALQAGVTLDKIFIREDSVAFLKELNISENDPRVTILALRPFKQLCDTETPQGIAAAAFMPSKANIDDCLSGKKTLSSKCLLLDGISDAGNLGTIIRSAAGFGYKGIFLLNCADPYSPKVVRSTMGAIYKVNIYPTDNAIIKTLKTLEYKLIAADMNGQDVKTIKPPQKLCLCIGSEAHGISQEIRAAADITAAIKQESIESLNAAIAGSILMYLLA